MDVSSNQIAAIDSLEERLSRPTPETVAAMGQLDGDLMILGAGGKMGPTLARLARRSADEAARRELRIVAVSRFSDSSIAERLRTAGVEPLACDLLDPHSRRRLPPADNVIYMVGHKFTPSGADTVEAAARYWAVNAYLAGTLAEQYRDARIVAFSTGNVYPFTRVDRPSPTESTPPGPIGEYAQSCLARERLLAFASYHFATRVAILRLNYAVEPRYGVPVDIARALLAGEPIDLTVPYVNLIWQADANAIALRSLALCATPVEVLNVTDLARIAVRRLAEELGRRLGIEPQFQEPEGETALLSDASRAAELFGAPPTSLETILDEVAAWLKAGHPTLGKPTRFHVRDGLF